MVSKGWSSMCCVFDIFVSTICVSRKVGLFIFFGRTIVSPPFCPLNLLCFLHIGTDMTLLFLFTRNMGT